MLFNVVFVNWILRCRQFISALCEDSELQAAIVQSCYNGAQRASDISSIIILASDNATMKPAAFSESLELFRMILQLCSLHIAEFQHAALAFTDNLMAHLMLPALVSHIHEVANELPEAACGAALTDGHETVISWIVLVWQCCEVAHDLHFAVPESLTSELALGSTVQVLLTAISAFKASEVKSVILRYDIQTQ